MIESTPADMSALDSLAESAAVDYTARDALRSSSPTTASERSVSPLASNVPWDTIDTILARSDTDVSVARKAENIYMLLRGDDDPHTPSHFLDEKHRWRRVIRRIIRKATRKSSTLLDYIQTVSAEFRALSQPASPVIGKHKRDVEESPVHGSTGFDFSSMKDPRSLPGQELAGIEDVELTAEPQPKKARPLEDQAYVEVPAIFSAERFQIYATALRFRLKELLTADRSILLPKWSPPKSWEVYPESYTQLNGLVSNHYGAHTVPPSLFPELLWYQNGKLHDLDSSVTGPLAQLRAPTSVIHLVGPPGSGKTRMLSELAGEKWCLLLACARGPYHPYGSMDVVSALRLLAHQTHRTVSANPAVRFEPSVLLRPSDYVDFDADVVKDILARWTSNKQLVEHALLVVIFTRLLVLEAFHSVWKESLAESAASVTATPWTPLSEADAQHMWALLQIHPNLPYNGDDIFNSTMDYFCFAHPTSLRAEIMQRLRVLEGENLIVHRVLLDDVEVIARMWPGAFGPSEADFKSSSLPDNAAVLHEVSRTLLRPVVRCLRSVFGRSPLVLTGTKLAEELVNSAVAQDDLSGASEPVKSKSSKPPPVRTVTISGGRFSEAKLSAVLTHFFGHNQFLAKIPAGLKRDIFYWLPGRPMFSMAFTRFSMQLGPEAMPRVLNSVVGQLTGIYPDPNLPDLPEMKLKPLIPQSAAERRWMIEDTRMMHNIAHVVVVWLLNSRLPSVGDDDLNIVKHGFGHLVADAGRPAKGKSVEVSENLVAASLTNLFDTQHRESSIQAVLNRHLSDPNPAIMGFAAEDVLAYQFWKTFTVPGTDGKGTPTRRRRQLPDPCGQTDQWQLRSRSTHPGDCADHRILHEQITGFL